MVRSGPSVTDLAWVLFWAVIALMIYQPRFGIYLIVFLGLVGDIKISWWFPFAKNFSSRESLLYWNDSFSFSPLEISIALTAVIWFGRMALERKIRIKQGPLFWAALVFTFFIGLGLLVGLARGGSLNVALWESRAIFYILAMLVLTSNLLTRPEHIKTVIWCIIGALFIEGLIGSREVIFDLQFDFSTIETLVDHPAAIHINLVLILIAAAWLLKDSSLTLRLLPLVFLPPIILTYIATQRRAAFLTLAVALALLLFFLLRVRRRLFWVVAPPLVVLGLGYLAVFWNSGSALGLPAQAVKSVIAPQQANDKDLSSNLYRITENLNALFTIRQEPLFGVGFGRKFYILYPLPDISFFIWWEYITHNSIIWIWMKSGVFGFMSMAFLIGLSVLKGGRTAVQLPNGDLRVIAVSLTLYLVMHFIFAYVDISWSDQSMMLVGTAMGMLTVLHSLAFQSTPPDQTRPTTLPLTG